MAQRKRPEAIVPDKEQRDGVEKAKKEAAMAPEQKPIMNPADVLQQGPQDMPQNAPEGPVKPAIGEEEVIKATQILNKYKAGKARLEQKIIKNEEFWKLRQWRYMDSDPNDFQPATSWLWSCIQSRYSDVMDSYPTCNFLPRQEDDKAEALKLSNIIPVILEQNRYEDTYSDIAWYMLKNGSCAQGVFWDSSKHNGLGDISLQPIDLLTLFWEPSVVDIQDSPNLFHTELVDNAEIEGRYPQTVGHLGGKGIAISHYVYDESIDTTQKSVIVDWYYHKYINGKKTLQFCKYVNNIVLYATENETDRPKKAITEPFINMPVAVDAGPSMAERGLYDHAMYPFVVASLYPLAGQLCGYGITDIGRDTQLIIDKLNKAIAENAVSGAMPRYLVRGDGGINEEEYCDLTKKIIHVEGNVSDDNVRPVDHAELDSMYVNFLDQKINELKYVTSNQDVNNGTAPGGVTSASGVAALMESGGKNARSSNKVFYRMYRDVIYQVVELIRQFYDAPRMFRIIPDGMQQQFIPYDNSGLKMQPQIVAGMDMGFRKPEFDIEITAEKANPYKKMEINDLALQFYNAGFFNPQMTTQALAALNMMDFVKKEDVIKTVSQNGTLQELLVMYQQMALQFAQQISPELGEQVGQQIMNMSGQTSMPQQYANITTENNDEHPYVERARQAARSSTEE